MVNFGIAGFAVCLMTALSACSYFDQGPQKAPLPASSYEPVPAAAQPALPADTSSGLSTQTGVNSGWNLSLWCGAAERRFRYQG